MLAVEQQCNTCRSLMQEFKSAAVRVCAWLQVAQSFAPRLKRGVVSGDRQLLLEVRLQAAAMMSMVYQQ
jgi:hypothetical protein